MGCGGIPESPIGGKTSSRDWNRCAKPGKLAEVLGELPRRLNSRKAQSDHCQATELAPFLQLPDESTAPCVAMAKLRWWRPVVVAVRRLSYGRRRRSTPPAGRFANLSSCAGSPSACRSSPTKGRERWPALRANRSRDRAARGNKRRAPQTRPVPYRERRPPAGDSPTTTERAGFCVRRPQAVRRWPRPSPPIRR